MLHKIKTWYSGLSHNAKFTFLALIAVIAAANLAPLGPSAFTDPKVQGISKNQEKRILRENVVVPFERVTMNDGTLEKGKKIIRTTGSDGMKRVTYEVTMQNGKEVNKKLLKEELTLSPVNEVTAVGTRDSKKSNKTFPNDSLCATTQSDSTGVICY